MLALSAYLKVEIAYRKSARNGAFADADRVLYVAYLCRARRDEEDADILVLQLRVSCKRLLAALC